MTNDIKISRELAAELISYDDRLYELADACLDKIKELNK